jgi:hypothetical protein
VQHSIEDVAEIFSKVNQAGTRVKEADVTLALSLLITLPGFVKNSYLSVEASANLDLILTLESSSKQSRGLSTEQHESERFLKNGGNKR